MVSRDEEGGSGPVLATRSATFELERFAWGAPDRLELSGSFDGLIDPPADAVLVVRGPERTHRLPPAPDHVPGPPENGRPWRAEFTWQELPEAVDTAQLQLGGEITVDLPAPGDAPPQSLEVRQERPQAVTGTAVADRLRLEAELLAAQEDAARARADLEAERERRAADAERFRAGLARVQESAEAALKRADDAVVARDATLQELRAELEAATAARAEAERAAADVEGLRERVDRVESARSLAEEAGADAERLLARLTTIRDAFGERG